MTIPLIQAQIRLFRSNSGFTLKAWFQFAMFTKPASQSTIRFFQARRAGEHYSMRAFQRVAPTFDLKGVAVGSGRNPGDLLDFAVVSVLPLSAMRR